MSMVAQHGASSALDVPLTYEWQTKFRWEQSHRGDVGFLAGIRPGTEVGRVILDLSNQAAGAKANCWSCAMMTFM
jgi:hypothetical protein